MRRLSYILIAITLGFTPNQNHAQDPIYSVAGDVSSPQSFRYAGKQQVHLRDLLNDAGYNNAAGIARILRGTPLKTVTTDSIDPKMTGAGSLLFPGDVVVFRSFNGHCPGKQNALAMFSDGPVLLEIPGNGYPVWRLFEALQIPHDSRISVTRTRHGFASEVWVSRHEFIQHGDIVNLESTSQTAGLRIPQVYQTAAGFGKERVSGIQSAQIQPDGDQPTCPTPNGERQAFVHENGQSMPSDRPQHLPDTTGPPIQTVQYSNHATASSVLTRESAKKPALQKRLINTVKANKSDVGNQFPPQVRVEQPAVPSVPLPPPNELRSNNTSLPLNPVEAAPATDNLTPNEFYLRTDAGQMLLQTADTRQTGDIAADTPFRMASLQSPSHVPASPALAPAMGSRQNEARNNVWNALFLTGLALAAGLIVFGWVKTKREQAAIHQFGGGLHDSRIPAADDRIEPAANARPAMPAASEQNSQTRERAVELSEPALDFAVSVISGDCPVLSAGIDDYKTADVETIGGASPSFARETISAGDIVELYENEAMDTADSKIQASGHFDSGLQDDDLKNSPQVLSEASDAASDERAADVDAVATAKDISPGNETFGDLEDLIQNRLPFDMKPADLPLRIALFGKPAGPRRLRIDAAHTQTAPPHIMTSARQEHKSKPAATTSPVSHHDRADYQSADVTAANADHERFDHALDFLEGQSDS